MPYTRLQIDQHCSWDVVLVIRLIEEDVFAVVALAIDGVLLQNTGGVDAVLPAELLPELLSD